jgi:hypothetical protein
MTNFINLTEFSGQQLEHLIDRAITDKALWKAGRLPRTLSGKTLAMIFEKPSLRTRVSFETAMTDLDGHAIYLTKADIGLGSREDVKDIARVLGRMCDGIMARTFSHEFVETLGRWDFYGKWKATSMSAHPKIDPLTGQMIAYSYQAKGILSKDIAVYTINTDGHIIKEVWLQSPYLGIIHDIAITQKHVLIPVIARTTSLERLKSGEPMWDWDGKLPTMVGVLPRDGEAKDVRWFKGPARNTLHFLNATDDGNKITMELPVSDEERSPSQIKRWTFNLGSKNDALFRNVAETIQYEWIAAYMLGRVSCGDWVG